MTEQPAEVPVLLESGDLVYETGLSATYIRVLTKTGVITPAAKTPRGVRLYQPTTVMTIKDWLNTAPVRALERKKRRAEALSAVELNQDIQEPKK
jgi:DNA-binding transcriptional MerR regulator